MFIFPAVADTDSAVAGPSRRCEEGVPVQGSSCDIEFLPDEPGKIHAHLRVIQAVRLL